MRLVHHFFKLIMPPAFPSYENLSGAIVGLFAGLLRPAGNCPDCVCPTVHCGSFSCGEQSGLVPSAESQCVVGGFGGGHLVVVVVLSFVAGAVVHAFTDFGRLRLWISRFCTLPQAAGPHGRTAIALGRSSWSPAAGS